MARRPKKWPTYALEALEETMALLYAIGELSRQAQVAARDGRALETVIIAGDIREKTAEAMDRLRRARVGDYNTGRDG